MAVNVAASANAPRPLESVRPRAWYAACGSHELRPGQVRAWSLGGRELVLFRTESGRVQALAAHCPHMGAPLARGTVLGCGNPATKAYLVYLPNWALSRTMW